ncbi:hypothetical protein TOT_030000833 [Theileria orientalis strain Shintoku]|uniref:Uncharacterized protein n=1 Tax=Theileria orientalis strain Shintoku TaxID=869250 RepID=J4D9S6_THEOR|nr:hypothetical protein TOT_030000833 [Theileria orientalis strain Shintoku]BAM41570.1 hypothetical protein TOT_030000833 [Theileria orientalis strain Shintoku]|eukprot:XP_009691871.1 hypothetical protein TOT_030000833 [Theileria orientalis strain Shintoku]
MSKFGSVKYILFVNPEQQDSINSPNKKYSRVPVQISTLAGIENRTITVIIKYKQENHNHKQM